MELKDVILSTLAEIGEEIEESKRQEEVSVEQPRNGASDAAVTSPAPEENEEDELAFLQRLRERLLVLFEGFLSPNNKSVEAKVDLTLNFLEYLLATLDERIERLKAR